MSGELQVVFIYDTQRCRREEDDPREAILFFHPEEISENRRMAICGQLMGITHFLIDIFSAPKILCLENGKFALKDFGRQYVLALGCSSVTPDWLLEKQADILYQLTRFFHKDIDTILSNMGADRSLLSAKLSVIMDHYIPISQHHGDLFALTFGILPILNLPKSANHISLNATVILQSCMLKEGVLGGIIMFQNKVIGAELIQEIAQKLAFIQPYQLPPADHGKTDFNLPTGVQLLKVFIQRRYLQEMRANSSTFQCPSKCHPSHQSDKEKSKPKINSIQEEGDLEDSKTNSTSSVSSKDFLPPEIYGDSNLPCPLNNHHHLNDDDKINRFTKNSSKFTTYSDKDNDDKEKLKDTNAASKKVADSTTACVHKNGCGSKFLQPPRLCKSLEDLTVNHDDKKLLDKTKVICSSLADPFFPYIRCDGKSMSRCLLDVYAYPDGHFSQDEELEAEEFNFKNNNSSKRNSSDINKRESDSENSDKFDETKVEVSSEPVVDKVEKGIKSATSFDNISLSEVESFNAKVKNSEFTLTLKKPSSGIARPKDLALNTSSRTKSKRRWSTFEDMMSPLFETPNVIEIEVPFVREKSASFSVNALELKSNKLDNSDVNDPLIRNTFLNSFRKLPNLEESNKTKNQEESKSSMFDNKLLEEKGRNLKTNNKTQDKDQNLDKYENALLFIYSLGGMRLLLLLEKECISNQKLIESLRDYGSSNISELEIAVSNIEEQSMSMGGSHHDHYCYLHYEPVWRSLAHGGRNHSMDFDIVQHMHQDFHIHPNINELIIRGDDHVVYGYQCVGSEVFYQQSAGPQPGLPMPSDLMGKVPFKAKRRLERDHNILLL